MDQLLDIVKERDLVRDAIATAALFATVLLLRAAALQLVRRASWASEQTVLRWRVQIRWASLTILALGLVFVWASELRTAALSIVAIAVACVIATKELILCVSGSIMRAAASSFSIGDRIEVGPVRGDVVDMGVLTTTVLEVGPGHRRTGRVLVFPNAMLVDKPVINETFTHDFVLHVVAVPIGDDRDWKEAEERLLAAAAEVCASILAEAQRSMDETAKQHGLPAVSAEPGVRIQVPEAGKLLLLLRVPTRAREKGYTEQQILRRFLETRNDDSARGRAEPASQGSPA